MTSATVRFIGAPILLKMSRPSGLGVEHDTGAALVRHAKLQAHHNNSDTSEVVMVDSERAQAAIQSA
jgi:hypothetical protein